MTFASRDLRAWLRPVPDADIPDGEARAARAARLLAALMTGLLLMVVALDYIGRGGVQVLALFGVVPLAFAALTPIRPRFVLLSAAAGALGLVAMTPDVWSDPHTLFGTLQYCALFALLGATSAQQRRIQSAALGQMGRQRLASSEKMAQVGRMTAGIAHELKTPVAATSSSLESTLKLLDELRQSVGHPDVTDDDLVEIVDELREAVALAERATNRIARFVSTIREQTRSFDQVDMVAFSPAERLRHVALLLSHRVKTEPIALQLDLDEDICVVGDPGKFDQVATNLIMNAFDAIVESGVGAKVRVRLTSSGPARCILRVRDDGPGIPAEIQRRVFEPMFTTRSEGEGTGLGLAICRDLVESAFHGQLTLESSPNAGAVFSVDMPIEGAAARATRPFQPVFRVEPARATA